MTGVNRSVNVTCSPALAPAAYTNSAPVPKKPMASVSITDGSAGPTAVSSRNWMVPNWIPVRV
eukprot:2706938-Rhodomonas_salina.4